MTVPQLLDDNIISVLQAKGDIMDLINLKFS